MIKAGVANVKLACAGLSSAPSGGPPDAFLLIFRQSAGPTGWELAWSTEPVRASADPRYAPQSIPLLVLSPAGAVDAPLRFEVRHWADDGQHALLGEAVTSLAALIAD